MTQLVLTAQGITDDDLARNQHLVRAEIHTRYEAIYDACRDHIDGTAIKKDPRMIQLGLMATRELGRLWRIEEQLRTEAEDVALTPREVALAKAKADLLALEAREAL